MHSVTAPGGEKEHMAPQALRLLLVEDEEDDALLLARELRKGGIDPDFSRVETPEELKTALASGPWDAIFSDYNLPAFTGLDALKIVREMGLDLPFILVSGVIGEETAVEALKAGAHDYLLKGRYARLVPALERARRDVALLRERRQTAAELTRHREHLEELVQERTKQLATANQELRAAHGRINNILEQMRDGFASFDRDWRCTQLNTAAAKMLQMAPEQLLGKNIWEMCPQARDLPIEVNFRRSLQENVPLQFELYCHAPLDRWFECRCHPTTEGLATFFSDITERRQLEAESLKARNLESLGLLAGGIAHDFNNLFHSLLGNISLAKLHIPKASEAFRFLTSAEEAYQQGVKLTSRLIAFSSGGFSRKEDIQPAELIQKTVLSYAAGATDLKLEFDLADDLGMVAVDVGKLEQVLQHLTINALEAMPTGGRLRVSASFETIPPEATISLAPGKYVKISFKDNGPGIGKDVLPRIFDPYFSTKHFGAKRGMGLGLSLCDTIIKKHGGAITVESSPGAGSTFQVYLPSIS
jgi:PAS domain S-box-containing protein